MRLLNLLIYSISLIALVACTPSHNWREVRFEAVDGGTVVALLPCKPDKATRPQVLGGERLELSMMGCSVGDDQAGATFTLSRLPLKTAGSAPRVLAAWQAATAANLGDMGAGEPNAQSITVPGAGAWPPATRTSIVGKATHGQIVWFGKQNGVDMVLYQAAIYSKRRSTKPLHADVANTFFESLRFP